MLKTAGAPPQEPQHQPRRERDDPGVDPDAGWSEQTADGGRAHREWTKYGRAGVCRRPGNRMQPLQGARQRDAAPGQAKTSPKAIAGRENSIGTKPVETLASKPNRITDRTTTPIGSHSESFSVRLMRTELTTACRAPPLRDRPPHVAEEKTGPTAAGVSERFSVPRSFARRLQDIESDTGYDTRRRVLDGVFARVSQTAVCDTC